MLQREVHYKNARIYMGKRKVDLTDRVERMDAIEARLGIALDAVYAMFRRDEDGDGRLEVNFDVLATGGSLEQDVTLNVSLYNNSRQLIGTERVWIDSDDFMGIQSCSETFYDVDETPSMIRIIPSK